MNPFVITSLQPHESKPIDFESLWPTIESIGPKLWAELHTAERPSLEWFNAWLSRVPLYCDCVDHFRDVLAANPIRLDDFFAWSVEVHNAVNEYLGKPILSLEDALQRWK